MRDALALRRQCLAAFRALVARFPQLQSRAAQERLSVYICKQMITEGGMMPAKDYRSFGEDTVGTAVRLPETVMAQVDAHITTLRGLTPWAKVGRSDALRDLVLRGLASLDPRQLRTTQAAPVEPNPATPEPTPEPPRTLRINQAMAAPSPSAEKPRRELPAYIQLIAETRAQYDRLSYREFAQLLYDRDIYKTKGDKPVNNSTLKLWLAEAGME